MGLASLGRLMTHKFRFENVQEVVFGPVFGFVLHLK
jgi:hypothetical protein